MRRSLPCAYEKRSGGFTSWIVQPAAAPTEAYYPVGPRETWHKHRLNCMASDASAKPRCRRRVSRALVNIAVLDRDVFTVPVDELREIQTELTLVGGDVKFRR